MNGYISEITEKALKNEFFRQVLRTGKHAQVVLMSLKPGEEIGEEIHANGDQILWMVKGEGEMELAGEKHKFLEDDMILIPAGTKHNFVNESKRAAKLVSFYSPPEHPAGTVQEKREVS